MWGMLQLFKNRGSKSERDREIKQAASVEFFGKVKEIEVQKPSESGTTGTAHAPLVLHISSICNIGSKKYIHYKK